MDTFLKVSRQSDTSILALLSKGSDISLDLISLKEKKMLQVLKVKVHFYLVSPTKYELWLDKRQLNVAFCACDMSCNRKMGLSLKIYDMPYWTKALYTPHPSNQPPESVSNAHHSLMNMINPNVASLWTPFKVFPPHKHLPFANLLVISSWRLYIYTWQTLKCSRVCSEATTTRPALCSENKYSNSRRYTCGEQGAPRSQEAMEWWKVTKKGCTDGVEKQKGPFLFNQGPSELPNSFSSPSPSLICIPFMSLLPIMQKYTLKK